MSDALEASYRRVLMMLPRTYWADHAEEMLAVLMDGAKPGQARPKLREVLSVATLAARLRFAVGGAGGAGTMPGDVARRTVLAYLVFDFGLLVEENAYGAGIGYSFIPVLLQAGVIAALTMGWSWSGRALCVAYGGYTLRDAQWRYVSFGRLWWNGDLDRLVLLLVLAVAVVVFHRGAPRIVRPSAWLLGLTAITVAFWVRGKTVDYLPRFDISHTPALPALIYAAAAIGALRRAKSSPVWPTALALAGLPMVGGILLRDLHWQELYLSDSPRDTFYVELAIGSEILLVCTALASLLFHLYQRRAVASRGEAA